jgi:hypothetical protein
LNNYIFEFRFDLSGLAYGISLFSIKDDISGWGRPAGKDTKERKRWGSHLK